jgi:hypothetical protein
MPDRPVPTPATGDRVAADPVVRSWTAERRLDEPTTMCERILRVRHESAVDLLFAGRARGNEHGAYVRLGGLCRSRPRIQGAERVVTERAMVPTGELEGSRQRIFPPGGTIARPGYYRAHGRAIRRARRSRRRACRVGVRTGQATAVSRSCGEAKDGEGAVDVATGPAGGFGDVGASGQAQGADGEVA